MWSGNYGAFGMVSPCMSVFPVLGCRALTGASHFLIGYWAGFGVTGIGHLQMLALEGPWVGDMGFMLLTWMSPMGGIPMGVLGTMPAVQCQAASPGEMAVEPAWVPTMLCHPMPCPWLLAVL